MDEEELLDSLAELFEKASVDSKGSDIIELGNLSAAEISEFQIKLNKNLAKFKKIVRFNEVRHIVKTHSKSHEKLNGQEQIESTHFLNIPNVLLNYDSIEFQAKDHKKGKHQDSILFIKGNYSVVCDIIYNKKELVLKTMWVKK